MRRMIRHAMQPQPVGRGPIASAAAPLARRPLPAVSPTRWPSAALRWLYRLLFVQPIGRRAREERLVSLGDRLLRDVGLERADLHAAAWGGVPFRDPVPAHPSAGTVRLRRRPRAPLTLVPLSKAA